MKKLITLIYGDGIGREVIEAARLVVEASDAPVEWEVVEAGAEIKDKYGTPLPDNVIESIKRNKIALKGPTATPVGSGFRSVNVAIRKALNLYANVRPVKSFKGIKSLYNNVDIIIVRENTEGLYSGVEEMISENKALTKKIITKEASSRIIKYAFEKAKEENRKKVTAIHKANIMKLTDGLFLGCAKEISKDYNEIKFDNKIVDAACMDIVMNPSNYDVIVAPNFYGDILSDLVCGLVGGLGLAPGANIGSEYAVFEPVHGSAPDIAGKGLANPVSAIFSAVMMLKHIGFVKEAEKIENAVKEMFVQGELTCDLGGKLNTKKFYQKIIKKIN